MANKIIKFHSEVLGDVRARCLNGEGWFVGIDVAKALGYKDPKHALQDHVFEDYKLVINAKTAEQMASQSKGGVLPPFGKSVGEAKDTTSPRGMLYIKEAGLYQLIFSSKLPQAVEFQRWVFEEVLPSIRKYGYWREVREDGKITRRTFTDVLAELYRYAVARDEFHHEAAILYTNYSKLVNKAVGVEAGERGTLTAQKLFEIEQCENICAKAIDTGMSAEKAQSEIYAACKEKLNAWKDLTE